ncbi:MAG: FHA domain-containing protein [Planctomycetota bacterium]|nr:FHA domain-containing protein [Planctomycetota bacterium]
MAHLKITTPHGEREQEVQGPLVLIGRGPTTTVSIQDPQASKEHCQLERVGNRWKLVDLESKNGTKVNGRFRNKAWLQRGDKISLGQTVVEFGGAGVGGARTHHDIAEEEGGARERVHARRRGSGRKPGDVLMLIGLTVLGLALAFLVIKTIGESTENPASGNLVVMREAKEMVYRGDYTGAVDYIDDHMDPTAGESYHALLEYRDQIQEDHQLAKKGDADLEARQLLRTLQRRIAWYVRGDEKFTLDDIMPLVERLKTEYADTENGKTARQILPEWFAGRPPKPGSGLSTRSALRRAWEDARKASQKWIKEWAFLEARERVERFYSTREALMSEEEREKYGPMVRNELERITKLAGSTFVMQSRRADGMVRNKNYGQAIVLYTKIMERFGLDEYVRKAQLEIQKIDAARENEGKKPG